jgi:hypothetical protein
MGFWDGLARMIGLDGDDGSPSDKKRDDDRPSDSGGSGQTYHGSDYGNGNSSESSSVPGGHGNFGGGRR